MNAPSSGLLQRVQLPRHYRIERADEAGATAAMSLRRAIFCTEQGLFVGDDRDQADDHAILLVARPALPETEGEAWGPVVGTVRIHQLENRIWQGSRLAVAAEFRRVGVIGGALIQLAVRTANTLGCERFVAQVQAPNVPLFRRLHWQTVREITMHGQPHHLMQADLQHYPAFAADEAMCVEVRRGQS
ncbi:MAG: GCN5-related N-acetyltransferase [Proteobacteria bacterium]|nr:GCN5-related N-acetyltransferase [Pseudomonadota bacterium]